MLFVNGMQKSHSLNSICYTSNSLAGPIDDDNDIIIIAYKLHYLLLIKYLCQCYFYLAYQRCLSY